MSEPEVLVVGAGPHGLTAACYLLAADPALAGRIVVADPQPWLSTWTARFTALELGSLRSACVHHPHPEPYALLRWAEAAGRSAQFRGPVAAPGAGLFADFCRSLVAASELDTAHVRQAVAALHPRSDGRVDVHLTDDRLRVRAVVLATGGSRPHAPVAGALHSDALDLSTVRAGDDVVVVGGGLTAAHLALRAAARGAAAVLLVRAPLRTRLMDVEAGWLGADLPDFFRLAHEDRARVVRHARPGTVPAPVCEALRDHSRVRVQVGRVAGIGPDRLRLTDGGELAADHVWLGTGYAQDVRADPVTARLLDEVPVDVVAGLPVLGPDLSWGGTSVHLSGGRAALEIGPAARGLAGARMAAERYTEAITGIPPRRRQYPVPSAASDC
ncbi:FAD/NAD(P)-binding protein [Blastococcus haudaquaticus]|uniref:L-lysine 6-monooxygenase (NADPH-requiring) n=1 Tax=Blastococcus haudaquaticus TaxID=1938745 RepID=A0A286H349_9ACTN|nr:FAD/NAD(P)-binding protein [Blastococcus haudaquaticus]SOE02228.1 L-lysine 6-monooxygenase (NADPH-requiring) [Blastococcus haudaquaticus]